jgi:hypothetical protein
MNNQQNDDKKGKGKDNNPPENINDGTSKHNEASSSTTQNQSQRSSLITGGLTSIFNTAKNIKNIAKNLRRTEEEEPDDEHIKIQFHVHLTSNISGMGEPIVIGSIPELGDWKEPKVKLRKQYIRAYSTYWCSEPVKIPIKSFQDTVIKYKYAIKRGNKKNKNLSPFFYEGYNENDNRVLEMCKNQFDIWMNDQASNERINDYIFLEVIYNSVNQDNFKDAILEYDNILKKNPGLTRSVTNFDFIDRRKYEKSIHKRLFLIFLLGHCNSNSNLVGKFRLPSYFHPGSLLEVIKDIRSDTFPSKNLRIVSKGIELLIHRDIDRGSFEWLNIFPIAHCIDPQYNFIDSISFNYDVYYTEKFFSKLDIVIPYIDTINDDNVYAKTAKVFLITRLFFLLSFYQLIILFLKNDLVVD